MWRRTQPNLPNATHSLGQSLPSNGHDAPCCNRSSDRGNQRSKNITEITTGVEPRLVLVAESLAAALYGHEILELRGGTTVACDPLPEQNTHWWTPDKPETLNRNDTSLWHWSGEGQLVVQITFPKGFTRSSGTPLSPLNHYHRGILTTTPVTVLILTLTLTWRSYQSIHL